MCALQSLASILLLESGVRSPLGLPISTLQKPTNIENSVLAGFFICSIQFPMVPIYSPMFCANSAKKVLKFYLALLIATSYVIPSIKSLVRYSLLCTLPATLILSPIIKFCSCSVVDPKATQGIYDGLSL